jgi:hypothetical protein
LAKDCPYLIDLCMDGFYFDDLEEVIEAKEHYDYIDLVRAIKHLNKLSLRGGWIVTI